MTAARLHQDGMPVATISPWMRPQNGISDSAIVIGMAFEELASSWLRSETGQAQIGDPQAALWKLFMECRAENWDGEGARAVTFATFSEAQKLAISLPSPGAQPEFVPEPSGSIAFEWYAGPHHLYVISVAGKGTIEFAALFDDGSEIHGRAPFNNSLPATIRQHLQQFHAH